MDNFNTGDAGSVLAGSDVAGNVDATPVWGPVAPAWDLDS